VTEKLQDILIVLKQLYAIRRDGFDLNDDGKEAFARLDPEFAHEMAERDSFWRRFKRKCPTCGR